MVTKADAINTAKSFLSDLGLMGYKPDKAILFGSMVKGIQHNDSDIDLAVWDARFTGCLSVDYEPIRRLLSRYYLIELHTFNTNATEDTNPFITIILKEGESIMETGA